MQELELLNFQKNISKSICVMPSGQQESRKHRLQKRKVTASSESLKFTLKKTQLNKKPNYRMENAFAKHVSVKALLLKICEELLQLNS